MWWRLADKSRTLDGMVAMDEFSPNETITYEIIQIIQWWILQVLIDILVSNFNDRMCWREKRGVKHIHATI